LPSSRARAGLVALVCVVVAWLFAGNVARSYFLGDDAFISFRYADNLVRGHGLAWNPGERVEGYTNFSWVLLMAASLAGGIPPEFSANVLGIASGVLLLATIGWLASHRRGPDLGVALLLLLLATCRSFGAWCTGGLETMFFTFLVFAAFARFVVEHEHASARPLGSALLFGLACLTRPEGLLFSAVAGAALLLDVGRGARAPAAAARWAAVLSVIVGSHLAFRLAYYGEWLPNTFYAKVAGVWLEQGLGYLGLFARSYDIAWFLPLLLLAARGPGDAWTNRLFLVALGAYTLYVACVGGDRFEFRFLVVVLPYLYWLLVAGIRRIREASPEERGLGHVARALAVGVGTALLATTALGGGHGVEGRRFGNVDLTTIKQYAKDRARQGRLLRELIDRGRLPSDLVAAMGGVGAVPYYTRWTTIDRRGLNDAYIARLPLSRRGVVAHEHDAPWNYLSSRGVVVFDAQNRLVGRTPGPLGRGRLHDGQPLRMRAIRLDDLYMTFATFVSDEELERLFPGYEILGADGAEPAAAAPG